MNQPVKHPVDDSFLPLDLEAHRASNPMRQSRTKLAPAQQRNANRIGQLKITAARTETGDLLDRHMVTEVSLSNDAEEGSLTAVIGASHSGKSHMRRRLERMIMLQPHTDEFGDCRPLLSIVAPSPCTLKALGIRILNQLDPAKGRERKMPTVVHAIWEQVHARLAAHRVAFLFIDEIHNVLLDKGFATQKATAKALKTLMVDKNNPIHLVLFGTDEAKRLLDQFDELDTRLSKFEITALPDAAGVMAFGRSLTCQYDGLSDENFWKSDAPERLLRASKGHRGRIARLLFWAAEAAVLRDQSELDLATLGDVYGKRRKLHSVENPFLIQNPATLNQPPEELKADDDYWQDQDCPENAPPVLPKKPRPVGLKKPRSVRPIGHAGKSK